MKVKKILKNRNKKMILNSFLKGSVPSVNEKNVPYTVVSCVKDYSMKSAIKNIKIRNKYHQ